MGALNNGFHTYSASKEAVISSVSARKGGSKKTFFQTVLMKYMRSLTLVSILFTALPAISAHAAERDAGTGESKPGFGVAAFPAMAYMPETSALLGVCGVMYYKNAATGKTDSLTLTAIYTLKHQYQISMVSDIYFAGDLLRFKGETSYTRFPCDFYGVGADTPDSGREKYTPVYFPAKPALLVKTIGSLYAGPVYDFRYERIEKTERGGVLRRGDLYGSKTAASSGFGGMLVYDTRDNPMYPAGGAYVEASAIRYTKGAGGDFDFTKEKFDMRTYFAFGDTVLCAQGIVSAVTGDAPFYYIPSLGGDSEGLRGYYNGRHIDRRLALVQLEYRFPLFWRFGMAVFAGAGEVAHSFRDFGEHPRAAGGAGIRFAIDREQKINLRFDSTYNGHEFYQYVNILESF